MIVIVVLVGCGLQDLKNAFVLFDINGVFFHSFIILNYFAAALLILLLQLVVKEPAHRL